MSFKRALVDIDINAIRHNLSYVKSCVGESINLIYIVKADCYGLGAGKISKELESLDFLWGFGVVTIEEAIALRQAGISKPILMLSAVFPGDYEKVVSFDIEPTVYKYEDAKLISEEAKNQNRQINIHLKIETGMNRTGIIPNEEGLLLADKIAALPNLNINGAYTHFSKADEEDQAYTKKQYKAFNDFVEKLKLKHNIPYIHCMNSVASVHFKCENTNLCRAGIIAYGIDPMENHTNDNLKPVVSYKASVINISTVPKGSAISYGGTFVADREMTVATISAGYADGIPRSLSNKGRVLIHGHFAPIVGRICMDQFMVDISHIKDVSRFDEAVIIGSQMASVITLSEVAKISGRFEYELLCDLGNRVFKRYII